MKNDPLFYRAQAAKQQSDADAAILDNVRDRCQRGANAWMALADRQERSDAAHQARIDNGRSALAALEASENPDRDLANG